MLGSVDALPLAPRRILVAGVSGVGKSTLSRCIAELAGHPYTEIDALYHGRNWVPREEFLDDVEHFLRQPRWVTEWQYREARAVLLERADTLVWLDLPVAVALGRVTRRTIRRHRTSEVLWNGNSEGSLWRAFLAPEGIVRWAVGTRFKYRSSVPPLAAEHPHLQIVRLRSQREVDAWVAGTLSASTRH